MLALSIAGFATPDFGTRLKHAAGHYSASIRDRHTVTVIDEPYYSDSNAAP